MYQQALLSWGNLQYEESQMVAVAGGDWRAVLDQATSHFREAGCNEADIRGAPQMLSLALMCAVHLRLGPHQQSGQEDCQSAKDRASLCRARLIGCNLFRQPMSFVARTGARLL